jgi:hypothetical protein
MKTKRIEKMPNLPKNTALLKEIHDDIKEVKQMQKTQGSDIQKLKDWKLAEDAYKRAITQVRREDQQQKTDTLRNQETSLIIDILKKFGPILTIIGAILYAYAAQHGIK